MTAVYFLTTDCVACHGIFSCNPYRVPVLVLHGERRPVCRPCAERWIRLHPDAGFSIPAGAYDPVDAGAGGDDPWDPSDRGEVE